MNPVPMNVPPSDAAYRRSIRPVVCYPVETLPAADMPLYLAARTTLEPVLDVIAPPRSGKLSRAGRKLLPDPQYRGAAGR